ncbi:MAG: YlbF family regulator [Longimicrobiales bacterium]
MTDQIGEKAKDLGRLLGQTSEYQALDRARNRIHEDRELTKTINALAQLESQIAVSLQRGDEPADDVKAAYETNFSTLQSSPVYQSLVAAQSNFDKQLSRVNDHISQGIEAGSQSRIILPT